MRDVNLTVWKQTRSLELRMSLSGILTVERDALLKEMRFFLKNYFQAPVLRAPLTRARQVESLAFRAMRALVSSWRRAT